MIKQKKSKPHKPRPPARPARRSRPTEWPTPLAADLRLWEDHPADRAGIEEKIWERWGARKAVMVTDLSSFSYVTRQYGILHFLCLIRRSHSICLDLVKKHGGKLIKIVADDIIAVFDTPKHAIEAAAEMQKCIRAYNSGADEPFRIGMCIGIESGRILLLGDEDLYGDAVNIASKLGEDLAGRGCILVGPDACSEYCRQFPERKSLFDTQYTQIAKVDFSYHRLDWENL